MVTGSAPAQSEESPVDESQIAALTSLARAAAEHWDGGFSDIALVKHRENAVFSARRPDGGRVAVRIHRHGYHSDAALVSELHWMREIARQGAVEVPPVLPAADGELIATVTVPGVPEPRRVSVLGWLDGSPAGTSEGGVALQDEAACSLFGAAGRVAALLHEHARSMALPDGFTRHAWDEEGLVGDQPLWGRYWDLPVLGDAQRDLLSRARSAAAADLAALGKDADVFGLIHADMVPENLLVGGGRIKLIDFDDAGYGWHLFELATALYFHLDHPAFPRLRDELIAGYGSICSLPPKHEALLPLFLHLRGTTYLGWLQSRPGNEAATPLAPRLIELACRSARDYLDTRRG